MFDFKLELPVSVLKCLLKYKCEHGLISILNANKSPYYLLLINLSFLSYYSIRLLERSTDFGIVSDYFAGLSHSRIVVCY